MSSDQTGMAAFTCINCRVAFSDADLQRAHYKTDWHRYNLKRKVAAMPPVTAENFLQRVMTQRAQASEAEKDTTAHCSVCNKHFSSKNQLENHVKSRKHRDAEAKHQQPLDAQTDVEKMNAKNKEIASRNSSAKTPRNEKDSQNAELKKRLVAQDQASTTDSTSGSGTSSAASTTKPSTSVQEDAEMASDSESCEEWEGEALGLEECLFCSHVAPTLEDNVQHMTRLHSFFIPDLEYVCDLEGLISYLGEKVGEGHMCLWCNERSKVFRSVHAVQQHMSIKGHCKLQFEGDSVYEYSDYYDYSSSYPDHEEGRDTDEGEDGEEVAENALDETGYELVLPSGATVGHRTLQRYYRQNLRPERRPQTSALTRALAQYKALGWTGTTGVDARKRAKDMQHVQRMKMRHYAKLGIKANKFQTHYRPQVVF